MAFRYSLFQMFVALTVVSFLMSIVGLEFKRHRDRINLFRTNHWISASIQNDNPASQLLPSFFSGSSYKLIELDGSVGTESELQCQLRMISRMFPESEIAYYNRGKRHVYRPSP